MHWRQPLTLLAHWHSLQSLAAIKAASLAWSVWCLKPGLPITGVRWSSELELSPSPLGSEALALAPLLMAAWMIACTSGPDLWSRFAGGLLCLAISLLLTLDCGGALLVT